VLEVPAITIRFAVQHLKLSFECPEVARPGDSDSPCLPEEEEFVEYLRKGLLELTGITRSDIHIHYRNHQAAGDWCGPSGSDCPDYDTRYPVVDVKIGAPTVADADEVELAIEPEFATNDAATTFLKKSGASTVIVAAIPLQGREVFETPIIGKELPMSWSIDDVERNELTCDQGERWLTAAPEGPNEYVGTRPWDCALSWAPLNIGTCWGDTAYQNCPALKGKERCESGCQLAYDEIQAAASEAAVAAGSPPPESHGGCVKSGNGGFDRDTGEPCTPEEAYHDEGKVAYTVYRQICFGETEISSTTSTDLDGGVARWTCKDLQASRPDGTCASFYWKEVVESYGSGLEDSVLHVCMDDPYGECMDAPVTVTSKIDCPAPPPNCPNLALNVVPVESSSSCGLTGANSANDGNLETSWRSAYGSGECRTGPPGGAPVLIRAKLKMAANVPDDRMEATMRSCLGLTDEDHLSLTSTIDDGDECGADAPMCDEVQKPCNEDDPLMPKPGSCVCWGFNQKIDGKKYKNVCREYGPNKKLCKNKAAGQMCRMPGKPIEPEPVTRPPVTRPPVTRPPVMDAAADGKPPVMKCEELEAGYTACSNNREPVCRGFTSSGEPDLTKQITLDFRNAEMTESNLGGLGGPAGLPFKKKEMRFGKIATAADGRKIDLVIVTTSEYTPGDVKQNRRSNGFGQINLQTGTEVGLRFSLEDTETGEPVTP
jgi:hypothetical protein